MYSGFIGAGITLVICTGGAFVAYSKVQENELEMKREYKAQVEELENVALQSQYAFALKEGVKRGDPIDESNLERVYLPKAAAAGDLYMYNLQKDDQGHIYARADLAPSTVLTTSVLYIEDNVTDDIREVEYGFIDLPSKLKAEEYIDLRIQFPSGDEYVLLSKKKVKDIQGLSIWFDIEEGELLTMSSAIYDAYVEGARIYAVEYVDDLMQDAASMTYPVRDNVKQIIQDSPNVINHYKLRLEAMKRSQLEDSINALEETEKAAITNGQTNTENAVNVDKEKRSAEERINTMNQAQAAEQEELVGGSGSE